MAKIKIEPFLNNPEYMAAYEAKSAVDYTKKKLADAIHILQEVNASEEVIAGAKAKFEEFKKISNAYDHMIEDAFGATWHVAYAIREHLGRR